MSIASEITRLQTAKENIKKALKNKGLTINDGLKISHYHHEINSLPVFELPWKFDYNVGYVNNGAWMYEYPTDCYLDIYKVKAGHKYMLFLGYIVGTRFRAMFTTEDVTTTSKTKVTGTLVGVDRGTSGSPPPPFSWTIETEPKMATKFYTPESDGYIIVAKDNTGNKGIPTYMVELAPAGIDFIPAGGTIFYIDETSDRQVNFYNEQGIIMEDVDVGDRPAFYTIEDEGTSGKDKFYIFDDETKIMSGKTWGFSGILTAVNADGIGAGKINTDDILQMEDSSDLYGTSIFRQLTIHNSTLVNGCNDWYIGSKAELTELINSGLIDEWLDDSGYQLWSSAEGSDNNHAWCNNASWTEAVKSNSGECCFIRSI